MSEQGAKGVSVNVHAAASAVQWYGTDFNPSHAGFAHEYFNRDWEPMNFAAMRRWLEPAKVDFACPAGYRHSPVYGMAPGNGLNMDSMGAPDLRA